MAVLIVTYCSAEDIDALIASLRLEAETQRLRVIIADNASTDRTLEVVRRHDDVIVCETGGNLGYAAGINVASKLAGDAGALLVLNPDLTVEPGCIALLRHRIKLVGAGVVVPRVLESSGATYPSLRREPTLLRGIGDAALGSRLAGRPGFLSEMVSDPASYGRPHEIEWATGAALLIAREVADRIGAWDERFFLYSEETDYFRRVRASGATVWYEPQAVVQHAQGGSGSSLALDGLLAVNRIRYARKYGRHGSAAVYRGVVVLHELARSLRPRHRAILRMVASEAAWVRLPRAQRVVNSADVEKISGAIIIPAHNEAAVIGRTLTELSPFLSAGSVDVIVAANGCIDETAPIARTFVGVRVLDLANPSKTAALNAADKATDKWPRLYLDADILISAAAAHDTLTAMAADDALSGRPQYEWDLEGVTWPVRAYYRARSRTPSAHKALWGAGAYALSERGHARFAEFPPVVADDLFVDQQFEPGEKRIVATQPARVLVPRRSRDLMKVLRRQSRGSRQLRSSTSASTVRELVESIRGPMSLLDAAVYGVFALASRSRRSPAPNWERDDSSRRP